MVLSIGCSLALYNVSRSDLSHNVRRQFPFFTQVLAPDDYRDFTTLRQKQLSEDLHHLKVNLVLFNTAVLLIGGGASYFLARRTLQPIEESLEAQSRFTADASHELRTPLTAMQSEIEVALRDKSLTKAEAVELLQSNLEEVEKLKLLSDGLLRLAQGKILPTSIGIVSAKAVAEEAVNRVEKTAGIKKIKIDNKVSDLTLKADFQSLVELLVILLDNAVKYSPARSSIQLKSLKQGKYVQISVIDKGTGIESSDLPHIFDRFYRTDNSRTKQKVGGYGLGLAIAKKIVEAHNGYIEVKSSASKGTAFTISIPSS